MIRLNRTLHAFGQHGFTLVEMAIGMLVIALLLGSILVPLSTQVEQRKINETQKALDEVREALLGFAITHDHFPCPDVDNDGLENFVVVTGLCTGEEGNLPWATLSTPGADSWGNRFRYRVSPEFARRAPAGLFTLTTDVATALQVCPTAACAVMLTTNTVADSPPAVVLSHGRNGFGAMNSFTNTLNPAPTSADELENADIDARFASHVVTERTSAAGEFDDVVVWVSRPVLFNRMVAAGKLP